MSSRDLLGHLGQVVLENDVLVGPGGQHAPGTQHPFAGGEEAIAVEPVQRLRHRHQIDAGVVQGGAFGGFDPQADPGIGLALRPVARDLRRAGVGGVHVGEARGQSARRLATARPRFPHPGIGRHDGGDRVVERIGVGRTRGEIDVGDA